MPLTSSRDYRTFPRQHLEAIITKYTTKTATMHAANILKVAFALGQLASAQDAECPELPETGVEIGEPVPINPNDIPPGCSDFEVLVGEFEL